MKHVGRPLTRPDDAVHLEGRGAFVADIAFPRQLHMRVVRSPVACAKLINVNTAPAYQLAGVVSVLTAEDVKGLPPIAVRLTATGPLERYLQPVLASSLVRYVGEPVAVVLADSPAVAEDAAELVGLDLSPLEPLVAPSDDDLNPADTQRPNEAITVHKAFGDLNAAFHQADKIVQIDLAWERDAAMPLETRGLVARWDKARSGLEIWGAGRAAHWNRDVIAEVLDLPRSAVLWHTTDVGGSFGVRGELYPEDMLVAYAAKLLERPVRWIEDRREHLVAANQARDIRATARAGIDASGVLLGLDIDFTIDQGAYVRTEGTMVADLVAAMAPGPYALGAYRACGHLKVSNKTPAGSFRGAGRAEAAFIRERLMDAIADRTGIDPMEVRRRNLIDPEAMPADRQVEALGSHVTYDSGRYQSLVDATTRRFSLDVVRRRAQHRRAHGELVGVGAAFVVDAAAPCSYEHVKLSVDRSGHVDAITAAAEQGQGMKTLLAQIVADIIGVDYQMVRVAAGDTVSVPFSAGTLLSRSSVMVGTAAQHAAEALREKILAAAASMLSIPSDKLTIQAGRIKQADRHFGTVLDIGELAKAMEPGRSLRAPRGIGLTADGFVSTNMMTFPYGLHVAVVEIDKDTGLVRVPTVYVGYDVGNAINPALVEAQIVGGVVQGMSSALFTTLGVSETGDPLRVNLADYAMPTAREAPQVEVLLIEDSPSPANALGIKGVGDGGLTGMAPAIAAAVDDALGIPGFVERLPVTAADILAQLRTSEPIHYQKVGAA
ncbi:xanthine dehydrogenase family protein molybdopterin-binding subunit [Acuticoccus sp. I52.16.1]|uniref:xanthine dehydrogenase family protein molybdopterin-binding subunit n=1 Tax=Acuticoccus sp. I52.16.1 TaxID=2928472 RepID=UPI001FD4E7F2|nr:xanthine dehydrogenase family protein molybdopterin-binding subunit [Acuticoccus sp. I52.16.1]UOM34822.1 xanthine dehydrogenase family protein molybdopterin-binding subunit [Acuticoccus sp. I52.16.1]